MTKQEFRQHLPTLRHECARQGMWLAWRNRSFSECLSEVWEVAIKLGATAMPEQDLDSLDRWIVDTLTAEAAHYEPAAHAHRAVMDSVWANIMACTAQANAARQLSKDAAE